MHVPYGLYFGKISSSLVVPNTEVGKKELCFHLWYIVMDIMKPIKCY